MLAGLATGGGGLENEKCEGSVAAAYIWPGVSGAGGSLEPSTGLIGLVSRWMGGSLGGGSLEPSIGLIGLMVDCAENEKWEGSCAAANSCAGVVVRGGATASVGLTGAVVGGPENE